MSRLSALALVFTFACSGGAKPDATSPTNPGTTAACPDSDGDLVCDADDVCPNANDRADTDSDGQPDLCDPCPDDDGDDSDGDGSCDSADLCNGNDATGDTDNDGLCNDVDNCPLDPSPNFDSDGDGSCNSEDLCVGNDNTGDTDGDGVCDDTDACPLDDPDDSDGDGVCDADDLCIGFDDRLDGDGDGVPDDCDACPVDQFPNDDDDGDGVCNADDMCVGSDTLGDIDGDGLCVDVDPCPFDAPPDDDDGDGVCDSSDPCPNDPLDDSDGDGSCDSADLCPGFDDTADADSDGVPDDCDSCPFDAPPDDDDQDGVCDSDDPCPNDPLDDSDGDGTCDSDDPCPDDNPDDSDGDGVCDSSDICPGSNDAVDTDGDGTPDGCDACPLDDPNDTDGDGVCDTDDPCPLDNPDDTDGDGVCDTDDRCPGFPDSADLDNDGIPNGCDSDKDGDGYASNDCNDLDAAINPGAVEVCDNIDNDCANGIDEADPNLAPGEATVYYDDDDGDSYGDDNDPGTLSCDPLPNHATRAGDCNDNASGIHPAAQEVCDAANTDEDCDGLADDSDPSTSPSGMTTGWPDNDNDTYGSSTAAALTLCDLPGNYVQDASDCDDTNNDRFPGNPEVCGDGVDQDCSGADEPCSGGSFTVGSTTSNWTLGPYFRANVWLANANLTVSEFETYLSPAAGCRLDWYVHSSSSSAGPWSVLYSGTTFSSGTAFHMSPPINVSVNAGTYYSFGVGWSCSSTYYLGPTGAGPHPLGTPIQTNWDNGYPGYSAAYVPPNSGGDGTTLYYTTYFYY